jgi:hypothetical protein
VETYEYGELVARLAHPDALPQFTTEIAGILHHPDKGDDFLPATATSLATPSTSTRVLLIGAPAAVGKSRLARALAADTGNPLWDLSQFKMGSNFFSGTIADNYGGAGYDTIRSLLTDSNLTFVLDAADEAFAAVGFESYKASVENLAKLISPVNSRRPLAVILGRPDTLQWTQMMLEDFHVSFERLEVSYFDETQSIAFVKQKVRLLSKRTSAGLEDEVEAFVRKFRGDVSQALSSSDNDSVRDEFLGYAPVLEALARFAVEGQPRKHLTELNSSTQVRYAYSLLVEVVLLIGDRERDKLAKIVSTRSTHLGEVILDCYNVDAQIRLLLQGDSDRTLVLPDELTQEEAEFLRNTWRSQFEEHPFRRSDLVSLPNPLMRFASVVFRDYCIARAFRIFDELELLDLLTDMDTPDFQPSGMLARFLSVAPESERTSALPSDTFRCTVESVGSVADELQGEAHVSTSNSALIEFELSDIFDFESGPATLLFQVDLGRVELGRSLANVVIDTPDLEVLIGGGRDFLIGNKSEIVAKRVTCDVDELRVVAGTIEGDVRARIETRRFESKTARIHGLGTEYAYLDVFCPHPLTHPWKPYQRKYVATEQSANLIVVARELKKFLKWFIRPSMQGRLTYPMRPMDTQLNKGMLDRDLFSYMLSIGMVVRVDKSYRLVDPPPVIAIMNCDVADPVLHEFTVKYLLRDTIRDDDG